MKNRYSTREFARLVGRSPDTVARWRRDGHVTPSEFKQMGTVRMHLYTDEDVARGRVFATQIRPGRPRNGANWKVSK